MKHKKLAPFSVYLLFSICLIISCSTTNTDSVAPQEIPANSSISTIFLINYTHPTNCFKVSYPVGWNVEEHQTSVTFNDPDDSGTIEILMENTGLILDAVSFENFINATEINWFGTYKNYQETGREIDVEKGYARLTKTLDWNKIPQNVFSVYQQKGKVIYWISIWENQVSSSSRQPIFDQVIESISYNSAYCEDLTPYQTLMPFTGLYNLFSMQLPLHWTHTSEKGNYFQIDTFLSPDSNAAIQNITYDDGKKITRGAADTIALDFLKELYAKDVVIPEARVQSDNSIRWIWKSPSGKFQGITFYETRGTSFLMLTMMYVNDQKEIYFPPLDAAISSYAIPK